MLPQSVSQKSWMWEGYFSFITHFVGFCDIHTSNKNTEAHNISHRVWFEAGCMVGKSNYIYIACVPLNRKDVAICLHKVILFCCVLSSIISKYCQECFYKCKIKCTHNLLISFIWKEHGSARYLGISINTKAYNKG